MLKRICRLLLPDERKMGIRVVCAVFLCALLDFAGLAALLPVLFFLLDDGRDKDAALLFCLVAIVFILVKNALAAGLSRFQNHFLMSLYRRLSFSLFTSYYQRGLLFIRSRGSIRLGYEVNYICYAFSLNLLSPLLRMTGELLLVFWVTAALLVYAPLTVLMLYIAFLPFMLIYGWGIRKPMRRYGEQETQARREQYRWGKAGMGRTGQRLFRGTWRFEGAIFPVNLAVRGRGREIPHSKSPPVTGAVKVSANMSAVFKFTLAW